MARLPGSICENAGSADDEPQRHHDGDHSERHKAQPLEIAGHVSVLDAQRDL